MPESIRFARQIYPKGEIAIELAHASPIGAIGATRQSTLDISDNSLGIVPALPMDVLGNSRLRESGTVFGAPLAARIRFEAIASFDLSARKIAEDRTALIETGFRDIVSWLWGESYRPAKHLEKLRRALVEVDNFRVEFERREWRMVGVEALPTKDTRLNDPMPFRIRSPFPSDRGAQIDRLMMREFGRKSAPSWRAWIRLAYIWDEVKGQNAGHRVCAWRPAVKRDEEVVLLDARFNRIYGPDPRMSSSQRRRVPQDRPATSWADSRAVGLGFKEPTPERIRKRVPSLGGDELIALCYDQNFVAASKRRKRLQRAKETLRRFKERGLVEIDETPWGWRVIESRPIQALGEGAQRVKIL